MEKSIKQRQEELAATLRYRIMSDDSGHEYYVPVDETKLFEFWLETFSDDWDPEFNHYEGPDYSSNRIDGRFTFSSPKCE